MAVHLCVLVSVTALNYVSLFAQMQYYCGLCKVAIELSQLAAGTKHRCRVTCLLCTVLYKKKKSPTAALLSEHCLGALQEPSVLPCLFFNQLNITVVELSCLFCISRKGQHVLPKGFQHW